jgi:hypothetical protein
VRGLYVGVWGLDSSDIAVKLGMLDQEMKDELGIPLTVRKVFLVGPDRKIKVVLSYPPMYVMLWPLLCSVCTPPLRDGRLTLVVLPL